MSNKKLYWNINQDEVVSDLMIMSSTRGVDKIVNQHDLIIRREFKEFNVYNNMKKLYSSRRFEDAQDFISNYNVV